MWLYTHIYILYIYMKKINAVEKPVGPLVGRACLSTAGREGVLLGAEGASPSGATP